MFSYSPPRRHSFRVARTVFSLILNFTDLQSFSRTTLYHPIKNSNLISFSNENEKSEVSVISSRHLSSTANPLDYTEKSVIEILSCYANDWERAFEFFKWVETDCCFMHTTECYNRMIDILGKFFEFDLAWNLIEEMRNRTHSSPNHNTFRSMFKRYASAHLVQEAIDTYQKAKQFNLKDNISFSNLVDALCEHKHVAEAEELCFRDYQISSLKNIDTKIYNMILRGWFKMGWLSKCREFWDEMDKRGANKDLHSYSIYMDIQCKSGKPWRTVKLYKEMKKKMIKLDTVAYNTTIRAIGISDGVDVAIQLYREMIELGCEPNVVTYNTIVKLLCENGRYKEAYKLFDQMSLRGCEPNAITYHCFFRSLVLPKEILNLFDKMIQSGVRPRMDTYVMLMRKFGRWGFLRPVLAVWKKMEEHGLSPDECAYNALIDALLQKGMIDMARKYDEEMLEKGLAAKPRVELMRMPYPYVQDNQQPVER